MESQPAAAAVATVTVAVDEELTPTAAEGAAQQAPPPMQTQRMPPSPFESRLLYDALEAPSGADGSGDDMRRNSKAGLAPTKSSLKDTSVEPEGGKVMKQALSWGDTHGKDIHHVREYQPSEHGSDGFNKGCQCCIQ